MRLYKEHFFPENFKKVSGALAAIVLFAVLIGSIFRTSAQIQQEQLDNTKQAIINAAVNCYATEGFYPADVEYLTENYGVQIDTEQFTVNYSLVGENTLPYVEVVVKGAGTQNLPYER